MVLPKVLVEDCWGVHAACRVWSPGRDPPWVDAASWSVRLPSSACRQCRVPPTWVRVTSGWMRSTLPLWGWRLWFRRVSSHYSQYTPLCGAVKEPWFKWQWAHPAIPLPLQHHVMLIASPLLYRTEPPIPLPNTRAHPRGECAPVSCHISTMSSSDTEVTSSRGPSFLVTINMHIHVLRWGFSDGTWSLPKAVAEDKVDILF